MTMLLALTMAAATIQDLGWAETQLSQYRQLTRGDADCPRADDPDEITVCAARDADKYRVPLLNAVKARDSVPLRTSTLTEDVGRLPCGQGAFLTRCGFAGVTVSVSSDGKARYVERERAR